MPHQRPPEPKSEHCKGHLHRRRAPENRSARPAQPRRQRGRNLPVFLRCSCSLDHPPEIILRLLTRASLRGRRSGLVIKLLRIQKLLRKLGQGRQLCRRSSLHQAGVTITSSSVFDLFCARLLKKFPRIGTSPRTGIFEALSVRRLSIRPAIAKLCPSRSSTWVLAFRLESAGIKKPETFRPLAKSNALTSGATLSRMTPSGRT